MNPDDILSRRLKLQRNAAILVAVFLVTLSIGAVIPRVERRSRELKEANAELVDLQWTIVGTQLQTRNAQAAIIRVQDEIIAIQRGK